MHRTAFRVCIPQCPTTVHATQFRVSSKRTKKTLCKRGLRVHVTMLIDAPSDTMRRERDTGGAIRGSHGCAVYGTAQARL